MSGRKKGSKKTSGSKKGSTKTRQSRVKCTIGKDGETVYYYRDGKRISGKNLAEKSKPKECAYKVPNVDKYPRLSILYKEPGCKGTKKISGNLEILSQPDDIQIIDCPSDLEIIEISEKSSTSPTILDKPITKKSPPKKECPEKEKITEIFIQPGQLELVTSEEIKVSQSKIETVQPCIFTGTGKPSERILVKKTTTTTLPELDQNPVPARTVQEQETSLAIVPVEKTRITTDIVPRQFIPTYQYVLSIFKLSATDPKRIERFNIEHLVTDTPAKLWRLNNKFVPIQSFNFGKNINIDINLQALVTKDNDNLVYGTPGYIKMLQEIAETSDIVKMDDNIKLLILAGKSPNIPNADNIFSDILAKLGITIPPQVAYNLLNSIIQNVYSTQGDTYYWRFAEYDTFLFGALQTMLLPIQNLGQDSSLIFSSCNNYMIFKTKSPEISSWLESVQKMSVSADKPITRGLINSMNALINSNYLIKLTENNTRSVYSFNNGIHIDLEMTISCSNLSENLINVIFTEKNIDKIFLVDENTRNILKTVDFDASSLSTGMNTRYYDGQNITDNIKFGSIPLSFQVIDRNYSIYGRDKINVWKLCPSASYTISKLFEGIDLHHIRDVSLTSLYEDQGNCILVYCTDENMENTLEQLISRNEHIMNYKLAQKIVSGRIVPIIRPNGKHSIVQIVDNLGKSVQVYEAYDTHVYNLVKSELTEKISQYNIRITDTLEQLKIAASISASILFEEIDDEEDEGIEQEKEELQEEIASLENDVETKIQELGILRENRTNAPDTTEIDKDISDISENIENLRKEIDDKNIQLVSIESGSLKRTKQLSSIIGLPESDIININTQFALINKQLDKIESEKRERQAGVIIETDALTSEIDKLNKLYIRSIADLDIAINACQKQIESYEKISNNLSGLTGIINIYDLYTQFQNVLGENILLYSEINIQDEGISLQQHNSNNTEINKLYLKIVLVLTENYFSTTEILLKETISNKIKYQKSVYSQSAELEKLRNIKTVLITDITRYTTDIQNRLETSKKELNNADKILIKYNGELTRIADYYRQLQETIEGCGTDEKCIQDTLEQYKHFDDRSSQTIDKLTSILAKFDNAQLKNIVSKIHSAIETSKFVQEIFTKPDQDLQTKVQNVQNLVSNISKPIDTVINTKNDLELVTDANKILEKSTDAMVSQENIERIQRGIDNINNKISGLTENMSKMEMIIKLANEGKYSEIIAITQILQEIKQIQVHPIEKYTIQSTNPQVSLTLARLNDLVSSYNSLIEKYSQVQIKYNNVLTEIDRERAELQSKIASRITDLSRLIQEFEKLSKELLTKLSECKNNECQEYYSKEINDTIIKFSSNLDIIDQDLSELKNLDVNIDDLENLIGKSRDILTDITGKFAKYSVTLQESLAKLVNTYAVIKISKFNDKFIYKFEATVETNLKTTLIQEKLESQGYINSAKNRFIYGLVDITNETIRKQLQDNNFEYYLYTDSDVTNIDLMIRDWYPNRIKTFGSKNINSLKNRISGILTDPVYYIFKKYPEYSIPQIRIKDNDQDAVAVYKDQIIGSTRDRVTIKFLNRMIQEFKEDSINDLIVENYTQIFNKYRKNISFKTGTINPTVAEVPKFVQFSSFWAFNAYILENQTLIEFPVSKFTGDNQEEWRDVMINENLTIYKISSPSFDKILLELSQRSHVDLYIPKYSKQIEILINSSTKNDKTILNYQRTANIDKKYDLDTEFYTFSVYYTYDNHLIPLPNVEQHKNKTDYTTFINTTRQLDYRLLTARAKEIHYHVTRLISLHSPDKRIEKMDIETNSIIGEYLTVLFDPRHSQYIDKQEISQEFYRKNIKEYYFFGSLDADSGLVFPSQQVFGNIEDLRAYYKYLFIVRSDEARKFILESIRAGLFDNVALMTKYQVEIREFIKKNEIYLITKAEKYSKIFERLVPQGEETWYERLGSYFLPSKEIAEVYPTETEIIKSFQLASYLENRDTIRVFSGFFINSIFIPVKSHINITDELLSGPIYTTRGVRGILEELGTNSDEIFPDIMFLNVQNNDDDIQKMSKLQDYIEKETIFENFFKSEESIDDILVSLKNLTDNVRIRYEKSPAIPIDIDFKRVRAGVSRKIIGKQDFAILLDPENEYPNKDYIIFNAKKSLGTYFSSVSFINKLFIFASGLYHREKMHISQKYLEKLSQRMQNPENNISIQDSNLEKYAIYMMDNNKDFVISTIVADINTKQEKQTNLFDWFPSSHETAQEIQLQRIVEETSQIQELVSEMVKSNIPAEQIEQITEPAVQEIQSETQNLSGKEEKSETERETELANVINQVANDLDQNNGKINRELVKESSLTDNEKTIIGILIDCIEKLWVPESDITLDPIQQEILDKIDNVEQQDFLSMDDLDEARYQELKENVTNINTSKLASKLSGNPKTRKIIENFFENIYSVIQNKGKSIFSSTTENYNDQFEKQSFTLLREQDFNFDTDYGMINDRIKLNKSIASWYTNILQLAKIPFAEKNFGEKRIYIWEMDIISTNWVGKTTRMIFPKTFIKDDDISFIFRDLDIQNMYKNMNAISNSYVFTDKNTSDYLHKLIENKVLDKADFDMLSQHVFSKIYPLNYNFDIPDPSDDMYYIYDITEEPFSPMSSSSSLNFLYTPDYAIIQIPTRKLAEISKDFYSLDNSQEKIEHNKRTIASKLYGKYGIQDENIFGITLGPKKFSTISTDIGIFNSLGENLIRDKFSNWNSSKIHQGEWTKNQSDHDYILMRNTDHVTLFNNMFYLSKFVTYTDLQDSLYRKLNNKKSHDKRIHLWELHDIVINDRLTLYGFPRERIGIFTRMPDETARIQFRNKIIGQDKRGNLNRKYILTDSHGNSVLEVIRENFTLVRDREITEYDKWYQEKQDKIKAYFDTPISTEKDGSKKQLLIDNKALAEKTTYSFTALSQLVTHFGFSFTYFIIPSEINYNIQQGEIFLRNIANVLGINNDQIQKYRNQIQKCQNVSFSPENDRIQTDFVSVWEFEYRLPFSKISFTETQIENLNNGIFDSIGILFPKRKLNEFDYPKKYFFADAEMRNNLVSQGSNLVYYTTDRNVDKFLNSLSSTSECFNPVFPYYDQIFSRYMYALNAYMDRMTRLLITPIGDSNTNLHIYIAVRKNMSKNPFIKREYISIITKWFGNFVYYPKKQVFNKPRQFVTVADIEKFENMVRYLNSRSKTNMYHLVYTTNYKTIEFMNETIKTKLSIEQFTTILTRYYQGFFLYKRGWFETISSFVENKLVRITNLYYKYFQEISSIQLFLGKTVEYIKTDFEKLDIKPENRYARKYNIITNNLGPRSIKDITSKNILEQELVHYSTVGEFLIITTDSGTAERMTDIIINNKGINITNNFDFDTYQSYFNKHIRKYVVLRTKEDIDAVVAYFKGKTINFTEYEREIYTSDYSERATIYSKLVGSYEYLKNTALRVANIFSPNSFIDKKLYNVWDVHPDDQDDPRFKDKYAIVYMDSMDLSQDFPSITESIQSSLIFPLYRIKYVITDTETIVDSLTKSQVENNDEIDKYYENIKKNTKYTEEQLPENDQIQFKTVNNILGNKGDFTNKLHYCSIATLLAIQRVKKNWKNWSNKDWIEFLYREKSGESYIPSYYDNLMSNIKPLRNDNYYVYEMAKIRYYEPSRVHIEPKGGKQDKSKHFQEFLKKLVTKWIPKDTPVEIDGNKIILQRDPNPVVMTSKMASIYKRVNVKNNGLCLVELQGKAAIDEFYRNIDIKDYNIDKEITNKDMGALIKILSSKTDKLKTELGKLPIYKQQPKPESIFTWYIYLLENIKIVRSETSSGSFLFPKKYLATFKTNDIKNASFRNKLLKDFNSNNIRIYSESDDKTIKNIWTKLKTLQSGEVNEIVSEIYQNEINKIIGKKYYGKDEHGNVVEKTDRKHSYNKSKTATEFVDSFDDKEKNFIVYQLVAVQDISYQSENGKRKEYIPFPFGEYKTENNNITFKLVNKKTGKVMDTFRAIDYYNFMKLPNEIEYAVTDNQESMTVQAFEERHRRQPTDKELEKQNNEINKEKRSQGEWVTNSSSLYTYVRVTENIHKIIQRLKSSFKYIQEGNKWIFQGDIGSSFIKSFREVYSNMINVTDNTEFITWIQKERLIEEIENEWQTNMSNKQYYDLRVTLVQITNDPFFNIPRFVKILENNVEYRLLRGIYANNEERARENMNKYNIPLSEMAYTRSTREILDKLMASGNALVKAIESYNLSGQTTKLFSFDTAKNTLNKQRKEYLYNFSQNIQKIKISIPIHIMKAEKVTISTDKGSENVYLPLEYVETVPFHKYNIKSLNELRNKYGIRDNIPLIGLTDQERTNIEYAVSLNSTEYNNYVGKWQNIQKTSLVPKLLGDLSETYRVYKVDFEKDSKTIYNITFIKNINRLDFNTFKNLEKAHPDLANDKKSNYYITTQNAWRDLPRLKWGLDASYFPKEMSRLNSASNILLHPLISKTVSSIILSKSVIHLWKFQILYFEHQDPNFGQKIPTKLYIPVQEYTPDGIYKNNLDIKEFEDTTGYSVFGKDLVLDKWVRKLKHAGTSIQQELKKICVGTPSKLFGTENKVNYKSLWDICLYQIKTGSWNSIDERRLRKLAENILIFEQNIPSYDKNVKLFDNSGKIIYSKSILASDLRRSLFQYRAATKDFIQIDPIFDKNQRYDDIYYNPNDKTDSDTPIRVEEMIGMVYSGDGNTKCQEIFEMYNKSIDNQNAWILLNEANRLEMNKLGTFITPLLF